LGKNWILLIIPIYAKVSKNKTVINEFDAFKALLAQGIDIDRVSDDCSYLCKGLF
jgi:hypothetical protein